MTSLFAHPLLFVAAFIVLIPSLLILIQCVAGWLGSGHIERGNPGETTLLVIIPAHNEELDIEGTCSGIRMVAAEDGVNTRIVVIADNCSDATAKRAARAHVEVLERQDPDRRGKGYALAWAIERLCKTAWDGLVVLDADARIDAGFFKVIADDTIHLGTVHPMLRRLNPWLWTGLFVLCQPTFQTHHRVAS